MANSRHLDTEVGLMKLAFRHFALPIILLNSATAGVTGLASCDSGPKEGWQPQAKLELMLKEKGGTVCRVKEDGGCYEVYALDQSGKRVEAYFHPVTLAPVPTQAR